MDEDVKKIVKDALDMTDEEFVEYETRAAGLHKEVAAHMNRQQVTKHFADREDLLGMVVSMKVLYPNIVHAMDALGKIPEGVTVGSVAMALMTNTVLLLRLIGLDDREILSVATRSIEVSALFDQAMAAKGLDVFMKGRQK